MNIRSGLLAAALLLLPAAGQAQDHVLKFGHAAASTHLFHSGLDLFAKKVAEKSGGKIKIEVYGDRQLGDDKQLLEGVQLGTIDGALVSVPTMPLTLNSPVFDALQLPFLVKDYDQMAKALASPASQAMLDSLSSTGIKGLGYIEAGQRHFLSRGKAVKAVADFAGLKTRIVPTPLHKAIWEAVGVAPIGMAYGEVFSALETGTIDAVEINLSSAQSESLYQAAKFATLTGHYFWPGVLMVAQAKFGTLSPDLQKVLVDAGHEVIAENYAIARDQEKAIAEKLKAEGVTIVELDNLDEMRARVKPVSDAWVSKDPLIKAFVEEVQKLN